MTHSAQAYVKGMQVMRRVWFLIAVFAGMLAAVPVHAQSNCALRDVVTHKLTENYDESYVGGGLQNQSSIYEVWANLETGTWTILRTLASGTSCIMASGTNYREMLPGQEEPDT